MHALAVAAIVLRITVWPSGLDGDSHGWTLRCGPVGGTLPAAAAACAKLAVGDPFAPTPPETACTAIYGGPQVARVVGHSYRGRTVWATFRRRDGCETARWNRISFLFR